jgi:hypothetical protein
MAIGRNLPNGSIQLVETHTEPPPNSFARPFGRPLSVALQLLRQYRRSKIIKSATPVEFRIATVDAFSEVEAMLRGRFCDNELYFIRFELVAGSLLQLVQACHKFTGDLAVIDFGSLRTEFAFFRQRTGIHETAVTLGSTQITRELSASLGVSLQYAELLKRAAGIGANWDNFNDVLINFKRPQNSVGRYREIVTGGLSTVLSALERKLPRKLTFRSLWISGGGSQLPGLNEFLMARYRVPVFTITDLRHPSFARLDPGLSELPAVSLLFANPEGSSSNPGSVIKGFPD